MQKIIIGLAPNMTVEIEADDVKQLVERASFWSSLPSDCPICAAPVILFHRDPSDNNYWGQQCTGPVKHEANFGVYKTKEGFYYKGNWAEAFQAYQKTEGAQDREPVAQSLGDMVTAKQLGMLRAVSTKLNLDLEDECNRQMKCGSTELSKRAASDLISYFQSVEKTGGNRENVEPPRESLPPSRPLPTPTNDDIPF